MRLPGPGPRSARRPWWSWRAGRALGGAGRGDSEQGPPPAPTRGRRGPEPPSPAFRSLPPRALLPPSIPVRPRARQPRSPLGLAGLPAAAPGRSHIWAKNSAVAAAEKGLSLVPSINSRRLGWPSELGGPRVRFPSLEMGSLELVSPQPDARGPSQGARGSRPGRLGTLGAARVWEGSGSALGGAECGSGPCGRKSLPNCCS